MTRAAVCALLIVLAAGCGAGNDKPKPRALAVGKCVAGDGDFRLCGYPHGSKPSRIVRSGPGFPQVIIEPLEPPKHGPRGYWRSVDVSPNGALLLATWSGECEIPIAFFIAAAGGSPRPVTGEDDWRKAPESIGLGWTKDGKARVRLPRGACGRGVHRPGVYLIDPGTRRIIGPAD